MKTFLGFRFFSILFVYAAMNKLIEFSPSFTLRRFSLHDSISHKKKIFLPRFAATDSQSTSWGERMNDRVLLSQCRHKRHSTLKAIIANNSFV